MQILSALQYYKTGNNFIKQENQNTRGIILYLTFLQ